MADIDLPFDASGDDYERQRGEYEDEEDVLRDVWGSRVRVDKVGCRTEALDEDGRPVPREHRQADELLP